MRVSIRRRGGIVSESAARLFDSVRRGQRAGLVSAAAMILIAPPAWAETRDKGLTLTPPTAWPRAVAPSSKATPVTFRALVTGTSTPPKFLCLDKVTKEGAVLKQGVAELLDDGAGAGGDSLAGDRFYAGTLNILSTQETEEFYRLSAVPDGKLAADAGVQGRNLRDEAKRFCEKYPGPRITSGTIMFPIINLPMPQGRIIKGPLVKDPASRYRFFADELLLSARPGTSPRTIRQIVQKVSQSADARGARIVDYMPSLDVYVVEFDGDHGAGGVQRAIKAFSAEPEVESAEPNFEIVAASVLPPTTGAYIDSGDPQWYLKGGAAGIHADQAWSAGASGCPTARVAIVDEGIYEGHSDLSGQFADAPGGAMTGYCGHHAPELHGTLVAGVIAAKEVPGNTTSMVGVAPNSKILNCDIGSLQIGASDHAADAITEAVNSGEVKVFNFSWTTNAGATLKKAICHAICSDRLVVAAAGNQPSDCTPAKAGKYPAAYNDPAENCTDYCSAKMADRLLAVGALDKEGYVAWDMDTDGDPDVCSNFGSWVDLYAPGKKIYTTTCQTPCSSTANPNAHMTIGGTTLSAAMVSGAAAVVWALHPDWKVNQVENYLTTSGTPLTTSLPNYTSHPYFMNHAGELGTQLTGKRLNLGAAALNTPPVLNAIPPQTLNPNEARTVTLTATDTDGDRLSFPQPTPPGFATLQDNHDGTATLVLAPKQLGTYVITLSVADDACPVAGTDSKTMTISVVNPAPSISPPSNLRVQ